MKKLITAILVIVLLFSAMPLSFVSALTMNYDKDYDWFWFDAPVTKATTNTRYKVIGYTVKYDRMETTVKLPDSVDPSAGNGKVTVQIRIPAHDVSNKDSVMSRMLATNPGRSNDVKEMWSTNCWVYFDAILTITEGPDQIPLCTMNSNGTFTKTGGGVAQEGHDYFKTLSSIQSARTWKEAVKKEDLPLFFERRCPMQGKPIPPTLLDKPKAVIYKNGTVVTGTLSYMDNEVIGLQGSIDGDFPAYANRKFYKWEYKTPTSSWSTWTGSDGEGVVSPQFPKLSVGTYNLKLTVWYGIGDIIYPDMKAETQITLNIGQSPQGAYVIAEPSTEGDIMVTQTQIDSNAVINIPVSVTGILKNYTDTSRMTQWKNNLRKDPSGTGDQFQAFTYTSGLGLTQTSQKTFTVRAGVLKNAETYTQKFAVSSSVTINGQILQSNTEYCAVTIYKGTPPPPPINNKPPVAVISAPYTAKLGDNVYISGIGSYDSDGTIEHYLWNIEGVTTNLDAVYGYVTYPQTGDYKVNLTVVDNGGAAGFSQKTITVLPPVPAAHFGLTGTLKEKRIISLANSSTSPAKYPIDASKNKWTITPVEGSGATTDAIYKITNKSTNKDLVTGDLYTSANLGGLNASMVTFAKAGQYDITLVVTNTAGYSNSTTQRITIKPDLPPVSKFTSDQKIYRETIVGDVNYAKITVNDESYSPDGDYISYRKIWAIYDANNNGVYGDNYDQIIVISETSDRNEIDTVKSYTYMTKEVGKYFVNVTIRESYIP